VYRTRPDEKEFISEASILLVALLLGEPVAYADEKDGALVQDVYPTEAERRSPSNESSDLDLAFHTELSFNREVPDRPLHVASPDFLLLLGLRAAPRGDAVTAIVEAKDLCRLLSNRARVTLRKPLFQLRLPIPIPDGMGVRGLIRSRSSTAPRVTTLFRPGLWVAGLRTRPPTPSNS
jgi:L-asparagine oxygenase